ncbi:MAG: multicopper oxidase domain-containing protein [Xanthomonadaceae bacterium]|nr:multicopper oxidase domain-containing protein [Xanthomonadaceae bacterium]
MKIRAFNFLAAAAMTVAMLAAAAPAEACPSCNTAFAAELLEERGNSLAGQDVLRAMRTQAAFAAGEAEPGAAAAVLAAARIDTTQLLAAQQSTPRAAQSTAPARARPGRLTGQRFEEVFGDADFIEIIRRDEGLATAPTSFVPQDATPDKEFTITLEEGQAYIGQGVMYDGFTTNGSIPGPTIIVTEGDIVRLNIVNEGDIPHGASIHAAYTQTSKYVGNIAPGETKSVTFRAMIPGVYMYHCAPGGHAIPMHVLFGQYGMIVVEPRDTKYRMEEELGRAPDVNLYLLQHEIFASGRDAIEGSPMYTAFNGKVFRYVEEPIRAKPGDYVRIHYLNVGPTQMSTFHIVGIIWDHVYWQGHPNARLPGGQTVTSGPSDSWVIEFRVPPDEGSYLMLDHSVGNTSRGAIGILQADRNAETPLTLLAEGPAYTAEQLAEMAAQAVRTVSPFKPGTASEGGSLALPDVPVVYGPDVKEVTVRIIGNSYYPKVIEIEPGTRVRWVNEEVFTFMSGEFSGIHNAVGIDGPNMFATRMLAHAESDVVEFTTPGTYEYICTPHPYMNGRIIVREATAEANGGSGSLDWAMLLALLVMLAAAGGTLVKVRRDV